MNSKVPTGADESVRLLAEKPAGPMTLLGSRIANIALTAQVQLAYACAEQTRERAQRAAQCIQRTWPDSPVRRLVLDIYRSQAQSAEVLAREVLRAARQRCGLAFARI